MTSETLETPQTTNLEQCWIVIPAFNEEPVIQSTLESLRKLPYSIVVVNDCSSDNTGSIIESHGYAHLCSHTINLGQGAALQTGIEYALAQGAKYIVTFDADGQHQPSDIHSLLNTLIENNIDVVLASRFLPGATAKGIPAIRKRLLQVATYLTRWTTGLKITDTHNGLRAFTGSAARGLRITQNRMTHASQILSQIRSNHYRYKEVPVTIEYTEYSLSKGQKLRNAINIIWESFTEKFW